MLIYEGKKHKPQTDSLFVTYIEVIYYHSFYFNGR